MESSVRKIAPEGPFQQATRLGLNEKLALISLMEGGMRTAASESPMMADLFENLSVLVDKTASGAKIDRLRSDGSHNGFKVFEINSESDENLGRLNMLYLNKPIPCYYLVYVEVAAPFRNKGLGNLVLKAFRDFLAEKGAVGILDNIIPRDDPAHDIYLKLDWKTFDEITGYPASETEGHYMVFIPPGLVARDLKDPLLKLLHHLKRKRPAIDMRDNELMVERTIAEFKDLYSALLIYFETQIRSGENTSLMRFMFTRFVTKFLEFRRRIGRLLGYTGGESLEQIVLDPEIRSLPVQPYAPRELTASPCFEFGEKDLWLNLPNVLKRYPARIIEALPNQRRPSLVASMEAGSISSKGTLTIGDLMDLGFDPTRLKELAINNTEFIFERIQPFLLNDVRQIKRLLERYASEINATTIMNARLGYNAPLLAISDRGNGYVLRRRVQGLHWEEAIEQLQGSPRLQSLNKSMNLDRKILSTVRQTAKWMESILNREEAPLTDHLAYFVSWDVDANQPRIGVDSSGFCLEALWIA